MILKSFFKRCALLVPPFRRLYRTANIHRFEREVIAAERDFIASERDTLRLELDQLAAQHYALRGEREIWLAEREALLAEREALQSERNGMSGQVRELRAGKEEDLARILAKLSLLEGKIPAPGFLPAAGRARKAAQVQSANLAAARYLDLLEDCLVGRLLEDNPIPTPWSKEQYDAEVRFLGRDWPSKALTMIGTTRLRHLRILTEQVLREGVPGDFLEAGVWRGGACIYVRSIFAAYGVADRRVWVADSFQGLPPPDPDKYPVTRGISIILTSPSKFPWRRSKAISKNLASWTTRWSSCPGGSRIPCPRPLWTGWLSCAWTATCMPPPW